MKKFRITILIAVSALMFAVVSAPAQTKVGSVDMKKLFAGFWKTKQAENLLDKDKTDAKKDLTDMANGIQKAQDDYQQLLDQASDSAIAADAQDKLKASAADKLKQLNASKTAFQQFQRQVQSSLGDKSQRMSANLVTEIQKFVSSEAKLGGYGIVVNSANPEAVVYASADNDLTDKVLAKLNAGAPIDVSTPATGSLTNTTITPSGPLQ